MRFEDQRELMVKKQLIERGITNQLILKAFLETQRELFVLPEYQDFSYDDGPLRIDQKQTISQPFIVAKMLELLDLNNNETVLEIGTGSGYQTALLAQLAKEVFTVERHESLSKKASKILQDLEITNVYFRIGDGTEGWINAYPIRKEFDKIIVSAGSPEVPQSLLSQLKDGGKMVIPIGDQTSQTLHVYTKIKDDIKCEKDIDCGFVPLIGKEGWQI